jgi:radical SAM superfamily enzyme
MTQCIILTGGTNAPKSMSRIQRSLGPYRIASALNEAGYTTFVLDYIIHLTNDEIKTALKKHLTEDTLWVGFSSTFYWKNNTTSFDDSLKEKMYYTDINYIDDIIDYIRTNSKAKLLYGGAKAPFFLADDRIDYYVIGYSDVSVIELTKSIQNNTTEDLIDCKDYPIGDSTTKIVDSSKYPEPKLDNITTHWWNKDFNILPNEGLPIELARGCIFKCKFCTYPLLGKKKGTYLRDASMIGDEMIKMWENSGTTAYYFTDDTFNDDNDKIESLHKVFTSLPFKPQFSAYLRLDLINKFPHQADLLTEMGLIGTYFGIETFQADSAKAIGKGLAPNKVKDRLFWLEEKWNNKVNIGAGFILGLPYDTHDYFNELINWCMQPDVPLQQISFYPLFLFARNKDNVERLRAYTSEFSLHPDIYGYVFKEDNMNWELPSQNLSYAECQKIANYFSSLVYPNNKVAEFQMITNLNVGVKIEDLYTLTESEIHKKYNMEMLTNQRVNEYKQMIGVL